MNAAVYSGANNRRNSRFSTASRPQTAELEHGHGRRNSSLSGELSGKNLAFFSDNINLFYNLLLIALLKNLSITTHHNCKH